MKKDYPIYIMLGVMAFCAIAFWIGMGDGRGNVCDTLRRALLDSTRVRAVIADEFSETYLKEIEKSCQW